jgi:hypothetical protein
MNIKRYDEKERFAEPTRGSKKYGTYCRQFFYRTQTRFG